MHKQNYYDEEILRLSKLFSENPRFTEETYAKNQVKRGLRDERGRGVITGLTDISDVIGQKVVDGNLVPTPGELYYRGVEVKKLIENHDDERCCGYEEAVYLLLFNKLPNRQELDDFRELLAENTKLPKNFVKDVKWTHIDIAGVAFLEKSHKELCKGASGAGVRTLINYILEA